MQGVIRVGVLHVAVDAFRLGALTDLNLIPLHAFFVIVIQHSRRSNRIYKQKRYLATEDVHNYEQFERTQRYYGRRRVDKQTLKLKFVFFLKKFQLFSGLFPVFSGMIPETDRKKRKFFRKKGGIF